MNDHGQAIDFERMDNLTTVDSPQFPRIPGSRSPCSFAQAMAVS
jgi:hypothetical protein